MRSIDEHPQFAGVRSEIEDSAQSRAAVARAFGAATFQHSKKFLPSTPAAAEAECPPKIDHRGSFPVASNN